MLEVAFVKTTRAGAWIWEGYINADQVSNDGVVWVLLGGCAGFSFVVLNPAVEGEETDVHKRLQAWIGLDNGCKTGLLSVDYYHRICAGTVVHTVSLGGWHGNVFADL